MPRFVKTTAALAGTALLLTGCAAGSGSASSAGNGGELTVLTSASSINLDPAKSWNLAVTTLGLVERRLTTWRIEPGKPAEVVPDLATDTGTPSDDGATWTYTLKDGIAFEDGTPITSEDIKYGIERSFAPELSGGIGYHKSMLAGAADYQGPYSDGELASIETPDEKTIVFHLTAPYGDWPWIASTNPFAPVPKDHDDPATYGKAPVATGPYKVESNVDGTATTLVRNSAWDAATDPVRAAGPSKIVFKQNQDPSTTTQTLISDAGSAETSFGGSYLGAAELALVNQNPSARQRLVTSEAGPLTYLAMNTQRGALTDPTVRQAIEYAVDRKAFSIAVGGEQAATRATTLITPGIPGRVDYDLYPSGDSGDTSRATALLAQSGHADGLDLTLWSANDTSSLAQAQAIQQGLARAGITVTITPMDATTLGTQETSGDADYDLVLSSWQPDFPSANGNIQPLFDSSQIGGGGYNLSHYSNPEVDGLIAQASAAVDPQQAQALWAQADHRIMEDAPVVPLTYAKQSFLAGDRVKDFFVASFPAYPNYLTVTLAP